jgi:hypothetical protein
MLVNVQFGHVSDWYIIYVVCCAIICHRVLIRKDFYCIDLLAAANKQTRYTIKNKTGVLVDV